MKRLALMQDCPLFSSREVTALPTASPRSAEGITMNASLPPSSSTLVLTVRPAVPPTCRPAASLPVIVTARTRSSSMIFSTAADPTSRVWNTPSGKPARRSTSSMASATCGTFDACLRSPTLPAISAGAANRNTCQ